MWKHAPHQAGQRFVLTAKKPLLISGGGVRYAEAHKVFKQFAENFGIAFGEDAGRQKRG
ncbi:MAG TPA: hypothetical protein H9845_06510 [Candidatus Agathobaculum pullicola]|nr:hypothetical protein [Candidatus Agathobaculum pullicola]